MRSQRRFLIGTWDGGGNTPAALNLGSRLVRRGHHVRLLGWESMAVRARDAGLEFAHFASEPRWPQGVSQDDAWMDHIDPWLRGDGTAKDLLNEAAAFGPDALVIDCMLGSGFAAARTLHVPSAALVHVLYSAFVHDWGDGVMHGSVATLFGQADRVLALVPPAFDKPGPVPANTVYVGPITRPAVSPLDPRDLQLLARPGAPWVLLSLSTTLQRQKEALPAMLSALASLRVRVLLTLGGVIPADAIATPPNVTVRDYLPHELVLPHMSAVITHGGLSTITASLAAGVPLVCIPQGREQPINAARVAATGAGLMVAQDSAPVEIAAAVTGVLRDEQARAAARRFAAEIAALGAGESATDEVEQLGLNTRGSRSQPTSTLQPRPA